MAYLRDVSLEIRSVAEKIAGVKLQSRLVGVYLHYHFWIFYLCYQTNLLIVEFFVELGEKNHIVIIAVKGGGEVFSNFFGESQIKWCTENVGMVPCRNQFVVNLAVCISPYLNRVFFDVST